MGTSLNSATDSAGPQALQIESLWWGTVVICTTVFVVVMVLLAIAVLRRNRIAADEPPRAPQSGALRWIAGGVVLTGVILFGLLIASVLTDRRLDAIETAGALTLTITGQQWWWNVRYEDSQPGNIVETANEIHIPIGQPVHLLLKSIDVIHSFWVPSLAGKKDLIPGRDTSLWIQADRAGVYQGQCAEFCGHQHAHMRFLVLAEPPEVFQRWLDRQRGLAREPTTAEQKRGYDVFFSTTCVMCHSIRGTPAGSRAGPDLTHLAGRTTIAAGTLPNGPGPLGRWIVDPQGVKPGSRMPPHAFATGDLSALLAYLESLE
jgi:cytochrome c oxidase subunit 2